MDQPVSSLTLMQDGVRANQVSGGKNKGRMVVNGVKVKNLGEGRATSAGTPGGGVGKPV